MCQYYRYLYCVDLAAPLTFEFGGSLPYGPNIVESVDSIPATAVLPSNARGSNVSTIPPPGGMSPQILTDDWGSAIRRDPK